MAQSCAGREALALESALKRSFYRQLKFIAAKKPPYSWGGASDLSKGLDCSGYIFLAAKWAGLPGVARTTSLRMAMGLGGWTGHDATIDQASQCDLIFWTLTASRPHGHVGAVMESKKDNIHVAHASQTKGVIHEKMNDYLRQKTSLLRKLSVGDPQRDRDGDRPDNR